MRAARGVALSTRFQFRRPPEHGRGASNVASPTRGSPSVGRTATSDHEPRTKVEWRTAATTAGGLLPDEVVSWSAFLSKETVRVYAVSADMLGCAISGSGTLE